MPFLIISHILSLLSNVWLWWSYKIVTCHTAWDDPNKILAEVCVFMWKSDEFYEITYCQCQITRWRPSNDRPAISTHGQRILLWCNCFCLQQQNWARNHTVQIRAKNYKKLKHAQYYFSFQKLYTDKNKPWHLWLQFANIKLEEKMRHRKTHNSYLSLLRTVHTRNLDVPMLGTWDDLKPLKVTSQDYNVTARGIGLPYKPIRHKYVLQAQKHTFIAKLHVINDQNKKKLISEWKLFLKLLF